MNIKALAVGAVGLVAPAAFAFPTTLNFMPIADILGHRECLAEYTLYGFERRIQQHYQNFNSLEVGLWDRFELGYDNDFQHNTTYNVKMQIVKADNHAVSVGIWNWNGTHAEPYVVGRYDFKGFRAHAGWLQNPKNRLLLGADFPVTKTLSGQIDFNSGENGFLWFGLNIPVPKIKGLTITTSVGLPNTKSDGVQHFLFVSYAFKI